MNTKQILEHLKKEAEQLVGNLNALSGRLHHNQEMQKMLEQGDDDGGDDIGAVVNRLNDATVTEDARA